MCRALLLEPSAGDICDLNALRSLLPRCLLASVLFSTPGWFSRTTSKVLSDLAGPFVSCGVHRALQEDVVGSTGLPAECTLNFPTLALCDRIHVQGCSSDTFLTDASVRPRIGSHIHKISTAYPQGGKELIYFAFSYHCFI